jgi:hypothetical protein
MKPKFRPVPRALARGAGVVLTAATLALAGCASTPQATPERDAEAKRFIVNPEATTIYVYRPDFASLEQTDPVLYLGDRLIGSFRAGAFFRIDVGPGVHLLRGIGPDTGELKIEVRSGELSFVMLNVSSGQSRFTPVSLETGEREILRCCVLMENSAPGQRQFPFLPR